MHKYQSKIIAQYFEQTNQFLKNIRHHGLTQPDAPLPAELVDRANRLLAGYADFTKDIKCVVGLEEPEEALSDE